VKPKPVVPRAQAERDVEAAIDHLLSEAGESVVLGFVGALEEAYRHLGHHPETASRRYGHELGLPGLRSWPLRRYPYLVFFVEREDHLDVWRVLHGKRDIPAWMRDPGER